MTNSTTVIQPNSTMLKIYVSQTGTASAQEIATHVCPLKVRVSNWRLLVWRTGSTQRVMWYDRKWGGSWATYLEIKIFSCKVPTRGSYSYVKSVRVKYVNEMKSLHYNYHRGSRERFVGKHWFIINYLFTMKFSNSCIFHYIGSLIIDRPTKSW